MELLKRLTQCSAVSGSEEHIVSIIKDEISDYVDETYTDNLGNLIAHKKGDGKRVLFAAHTDEIGIMANYIDDCGYIRFACVGKVNLYAALYQRVKFSSDVYGVVCCDAKHDIKNGLKTKDMYIDIGASSKEEALSMVSPGDTASFCGDFRISGDKIISKALDNRAGVYSLVQAIKRINYNSFDLYFVFSSQKELGLRGVKPAVYNINPDIAISVDVTDTGDTPNCEIMDTKLGGGVAVKIMDKSVITHKGLRNAICQIAQESGIDYQYEILTFGDNDAGAMQTIRGGAVTGALSVPVRYIHTPCETAHTSDINACINLICEICKKDFILV